MRIFAIAAAAMFIAGAAYAQSAIQNPSVPGSGYKIPETQQTGTPTTSQTVPVPGRGTSAPGAGYRIPEKASPTAPASPAGNPNGDLPKGGKNKSTM